MPKPALGPVAVGDRLLVIPATFNNRMRREPVEAVVVKAARVWIDLDEVDGPRSWRLRLDSQDDGRNGAYCDRFVTTEQYSWERRQRRVRAELFDAGISLTDTTPWCDEDRQAALANFIRQYNGLDPL